MLNSFSPFVSTTLLIYPSILQPTFFFLFKFEQNERLKKALIATFPRILVEAAPRDRLWGIGMGSSNIKAYSRLTWRGQNKLGYLLTNIRNEIMEKEGLFSELSGVWCQRYDFVQIRQYMCIEIFFLSFGIILSTCV